MALRQVADNLVFLTHPYVRYAIVGAVTLISLPGLGLRYPEVSVYLRSHPVRSLIEIAGFGTGFAGLLSDFLGLHCTTAFKNALAGYIPQVVSQWDALPVWARLGLRAVTAFAFYASFSVGFNPLPRSRKDLTGKTVLITGATNGLGLFCAHEFALLGAKVIFVARDRKKAEDICKKINRDVVRANVDYILADQSDLKAVASLEADLAREAPNGFDIVLLNAGYAPPAIQALGPSQLESSITTMHLSHFLLMKMIWKNLRPNARVVITASVGASGCSDVNQILEGVRSSKPETHPKFAASIYYARAKLANAMFARSLGLLADMDPRNIKVSSHHPGCVATNIWEGVSPAWLRILLARIALLQMRNLRTGSATLLDAAIDDEPLDGEDEAGNGAFYMNSTWINTGFFYQPLIYDQVARDKLWSQSEELIAPFQPASASWS